MPENTERRPFLTSLISQLENFRVWLVLMALGTAGRLWWLVANRHQLKPQTTVSEWTQFFWTGIRFDALAITYLALPIIIATMFLVVMPHRADTVRRLRTWWLGLLTFAFTVLAFANVVYYQVYNNVFDDFIFAFFDGNATNTMNTAVREYGLIPKLGASLLVCAMVVFAYRRWLDRPIVLPVVVQQAIAKRPAQVASTIITFAMIGVTLRGSIGPRPLQDTDSGATRYRVLNLGTYHPVYSLRMAWLKHSRASDYFHDRRLVSNEMLVRHSYIIAETTDVAADTNDLMAGDPTSFSFPAWQRTTSGPPNVKPRHVFVLFMESYDSWPFLDEFRDLRLVENGKRFGQQGHHLRTFLPGGNSSVVSGLVTLQGLFQTCLAKQERLPTSMVQLFHQLGYRTRCVNSFSSQWGGAERLAVEQGFDEVYCTQQIKPGGETSAMQIHDRTLFEFAAGDLAYDQPTFNFIRTSSYHTPFLVDVESEGCAVPAFPSHVRRPGMFDEQRLRYAYGHLKYSDKVMGEFVDQMTRRYPDSLFVITGDHYGRRFMCPNIPPYQGSSVPLILYGPQVLAGTAMPDNMAASHVDLVATLAELCAPRGFHYASVGKSVLKPCHSPVGVGEDFVIFPNALVCLRNPAVCSKLPWQTGDLSKQQKTATIARAREIYQAYYGVSYMLARRSLERGDECVASEPASRTLR